MISLMALECQTEGDLVTGDFYARSTSIWTDHHTKPVAQQFMQFTEDPINWKREIIQNELQGYVNEGNKLEDNLPNNFLILRDKFFWTGMFSFEFLLPPNGHFEQVLYFRDLNTAYYSLEIDLNNQTPGEDTPKNIFLNKRTQSKDADDNVVHEKNQYMEAHSKKITAN